MISNDNFYPGLVFQMIYKVRKKNILIKNIALTNQIEYAMAINDERKPKWQKTPWWLRAFSQASALWLMVELTKFAATNQATRNEIANLRNV